MKRVLLAATATAAALAALPALAQTAAPTSGAYGTLGYSHVDGDGVGLGTVQGRLGYKFNPYLGVEGEGALGVDTDSETLAGTTVETKIKRSVAGYGVVSAPVSQNFDVFARAGYGNSRLRVETPLVRDTVSADSWNYGLGAQYSFDGQNGIRADWTRHDFTKGRGKADAFGVSYVRKF